MSHIDALLACGSWVLDLLENWVPWFTFVNPLRRSELSEWGDSGCWFEVELWLWQVKHCVVICLDGLWDADLVSMFWRVTRPLDVSDRSEVMIRINVFEELHFHSIVIDDVKVKCSCNTFLWATSWLWRFDDLASCALWASHTRPTLLPEIYTQLLTHLWWCLATKLRTLFVDWHLNLRVDSRIP